MENPFPLEIENKEDSWELEQLLMGVQSRFKLPAEEFNKIRVALEFLYTQLMNTEGGLPSNTIGNIPSQEYIVNAIDWSGDLQEYARIWNAVNASTTIFLVRSNQTLYFRTKRIVFDTVNPNDYTIIVRRWRETRKYSNESSVVSIGGNSQITLSPTTSRLALEYEERNSVVDGEIVNGFTQPLGEVTDIAQSVNSLGVDLFPQQDEILFTDNADNFWIYQGQAEVIGQSGTTVPTDFLEFIEDNIQVDDGVSTFNTIYNVKDFGAVGDGVTDDYISINLALSKLESLNGGALYFPKGIYLTSSTLYLPSNVKISGEGKTLSVIKAKSDAVFDIIEPFRNEDGPNFERYKWKSMVTTKGADRSTQSIVTKNIEIANLGFDYNEVAVGDNSASEILMGRAENCHVHDVKFYDALPIDQQNTQDQTRGHCILFSFAKNCSVYNSEVGASDYESVSAWYASEYIDIYNNVFTTDKPYTSKPQSHCIQFAVPNWFTDEMIAEFGVATPRFLSVYDNTFLMKRGVESAITVHSAHFLKIYNNRIISFDENRTFWGIKVFDESENYEVYGNIIDFREKEIVPQGISAIGTNGTNGADNLPCNNGVVRDNIVYVTKPANSTVTLDRPIIGTQETIANNVTIANNIIYIYDYDNIPVEAYAINGVNNVLENNQVHYINASEPQTNGAIAYFINETSNSVIRNNSSYGDEINRFIFFNPSVDIGRTSVVGNKLDNDINESGESINKDHPNVQLFVFEDVTDYGWGNGLYTLNNPAVSVDLFDWDYTSDLVRVAGSALNTPKGVNGYAIRGFRGPNNRFIHYYGDDGSTYTNVKTSGNWTGWSRVGSGLPDTPWADLPLTTGISGTVQYKRKNGRIIIEGSATNNTGNEITSLGTLPSVFRPTRNRFVRLDVDGVLENALIFSGDILITIPPNGGSINIDVEFTQDTSD